MGRLTFVTKDSEVLFHPEDLPDDEGVTITQLAVAKRFRALETIAERLANMEQAEEQGMLLRLPCKVGDTIYEVSYENRKYIIREHIVNQFVYTSYRNPRIEIYCEGENGFLSSSITGQLDDGLFLNREEAEAKLAEMEKKHEV